MSDETYHSGNIGLADKLGLVKYNTDETGSHLKAKDADVCRRCETKPCISCCCAEVYRWRHEDGTLEIAYENCLECGTCQIVCPYGNFDWSYPRGGFGLAYKYG